MKYLLLVILFSTAFQVTLFPVILTVKQDGTGDFDNINQAIIQATDGDTVLVYPGVYEADINFLGKNITLTSLYGFAGNMDRSLITETVIDGNYEVRGVIFESGESRQAVLNGFTVTRGYGGMGGVYHAGGGIDIDNHSSPTISNCIIEYNQAFYGGGIKLMTGNPLLKGNILRYNHAFRSAGIANGGMEGDMVFCTENLNSVYLNYGYRAYDFVLTQTQSPIVLDTFSVYVAEGDWHDDSFNDFIYVWNNPGFSLTYNAVKIERVQHDLYISPAGCDNNSGVTPDEPLQTIAMAMLKLEPHETEQYTIHVAEGIYSKSLNNQRFPIKPRSNIHFIGADMNTTILDAEEMTWFFHGWNGSHIISDRIENVTVKNFSLINGGNYRYSGIESGINIGDCDNIVLENLYFHNCRSYNKSTLAIGVATYTIFKNITLDSCRGNIGLNTQNAFDHFYSYLENIKIIDYQTAPPSNSTAPGTGIGVMGQGYTNKLNADIVNLEVTDNIIKIRDPFYYGAYFGNILFQKTHARLINATVGNNISDVPTAQRGAAVSIAQAKIEIWNSIIYGNWPRAISILPCSPDPPHNQVPTHLTVSHSLVEGGLNDIFNPNSSGLNMIYWDDETNLDTDPLWIGENDKGLYPYWLSEYSLAIDAGTLDIHDFEFPEYDLAGNPRIYGSSIDMGAYEWNPELNTQEEYSTFDAPGFDYKLRNFPNPVTRLQKNQRGPGTGTTISFKIPFEGHIALDIYNLKGQHIRRIMDGYSHNGEFNAFWDGRDSRDNLVSTGFYMYQLKFNGDVVASGKCTFIK